MLPRRDARTMKTLILFSAWANGLDAKSDSNWVEWYRHILEHHFAEDDKIVSINHTTPQSVRERFLDIKNTVVADIVTGQFHINSDASGFQLALKHAIDLIPSYDIVLFIHTKGISYHFSLFQEWRDLMAKTFFNRKFLDSCFENRMDLLYLARGHAEPEIWRIRQARQMATDLDLPHTPFSLYATNTIYGVSAASLSRLLCRLPPAFLNQNLLEQGFDRFLFETLFPTLLTAVVSDLKIVGDAGYHGRLNKQISFDAFPGHCSSILLDSFRSHRTDRLTREQQPTPYVFGPADLVTKMHVAYSNRA